MGQEGVRGPWAPSVLRQTFLSSKEATGSPPHPHTLQKWSFIFILISPRAPIHRELLGGLPEVPGTRRIQKPHCAGVRSG